MAEVTELSEFFKSEINKIRNTPVKVAVCGSSGQGKSSIINAFRGVLPSSPDAAKIGVTETTMKVIVYPDPNNPNIQYYDLPGVGTPSFPQHSYEQQTDFGSYDFYLILSATRFTENDSWLSKRVLALEKHFFFVRTKFDQDLDNENDLGPNARSEKQLVEDIRNYCTTELQKLSISAPVYVLSTKIRYSEKWDYPVLLKSIFEILPIAKREALTIYMRSYSNEIIQRKYDLLASKIKYYAALSGLTATFPVPGLSITVDVGILLMMAKEFQIGFGLSETQAASLGPVILHLDTVVIALRESTAMLTTETLLEFVAQNAAGVAAEELVRIIPVIGQVVAGTISFGCVMAAGFTILDKMRQNAKIIALAVLQSNE